MKRLIKKARQLSSEEINDLVIQADTIARKYANSIRNNKNSKYLDDLVQNTLVTVYEKLCIDSTPTEINFGAWVIGVFINASKKLFGKEKYYVLMQENDEGKTSEDTIFVSPENISENIVEQNEYEQKQKMIQYAISQLSEIEQEIVKKWYQYGNIKVICDDYKLKPHEAQQQLDLIVDKMRKYIDNNFSQTFDTSGNTSSSVQEFNNVSPRLKMAIEKLKEKYQEKNGIIVIENLSKYSDIYAIISTEGAKVGKNIKEFIETDLSYIMGITLEYNPKKIVYTVEELAEYLVANFEDGIISGLKKNHRDIYQAIAIRAKQNEETIKDYIEKYLSDIAKIEFKYESLKVEYSDEDIVNMLLSKYHDGIIVDLRQSHGDLYKNIADRAKKNQKTIKQYIEEVLSKISPIELKYKAREQSQTLTLKDIVNKILTHYGDGQIKGLKKRDIKLYDSIRIRAKKDGKNIKQYVEKVLSLISSVPLRYLDGSIKESSINKKTKRLIKKQK